MLGRVVITSGVHRFKLDTSSVPEATQQKSQDSLRPATTCLGPSDLCGRVESRGVLARRVHQAKTDQDLTSGGRD